MFGVILIIIAVLVLIAVVAFLDLENGWSASLKKKKRQEIIWQQLDKISTYELRELANEYSELKRCYRCERNSSKGPEYQSVADTINRRNIANSKSKCIKNICRILKKYNVQGVSYCDEMDLGEQLEVLHEILNKRKY